MHIVQHKRKTNLNLEYVDVSALKPYCNNPRKHSSKQLETLARAMDEFGFTNPILIDRDNAVIAGHARLEIARTRSITSVPIIRLEHLTPAQVNAYRIADNQIADLAEWDEEALKFELKALAELNFDLTLTGFELPKIDMLLNQDAAEPEAEDETLLKPDGGPVVTRTGDIWVLGDHRILCGDALNAKSYKTVLDGDVADIIFTDPPYNVPIKGHVLMGQEHRHDEFAMAAGEMSDVEFKDFLKTVLTHARDHSRIGSIHYVCMDWRHIVHLLAAGGGVYTEYKNLCVWNKSNGGMGSLYRSKHELIAVFKNGTAPHINNIELGKHGRYRTNVWDYPGQASIDTKADNEIEMHPTPKPVPMIADALLDCSNMGDIVLDAFGGSGSTLIAAEKTQRKARLIEIAPGYVDVTVKRWQELTGREATLLSTGQTFAEVKVEREGGE